MSLPIWLDIAIQIVLAIVIILIFYIFTLYVLNIDTIVQRSGLELKPKEFTTLVNGWGSPAFLFDLNFNTLNPFVDNFKRISRSANQYGGASFTYQFWIKVEDANDKLFKDLVLFTKGDKKKYNLAYYRSTDENTNTYTLSSALPADSYVACPKVSFGNSYRQLKVFLNTNNDPYCEIIINMDAIGEPSSRKNILSLLPLSWTMFTLVFEDHYSVIENAENGIKFTLYVNDIQYWNVTPSGKNSDVFRNNAIKQNDGNIYFLPSMKNQTSEFMKMGNFKYYNYPVTSSDVQKTYQNGPPQFPAMSKKDKAQSKPSYISALNKIDALNY